MIVDELLGFFGAAVYTTQYTAQTLIAHFSQNTVSLAIARDEFKRIAAQKHGSDDLDQLSKADLLKKSVSLETCHDMQYLTWVLQESLRIQPPADYTSDLCFS